jgi:acetyltransferase-like isoleucine patch superfamily enzyme
MPIFNSRLGDDVKCYHESLINVYDSSIGQGTKLGDFCEIGRTDIGEDCIISAYVMLNPGTKVGNRVFIGPKSITLNHRKVEIDPNFAPEGVIIEDDVVIGACVTIMAGVRIGSRAKVAAGALVLVDVPADAVVAGLPSRERDDIWQDSFKQMELFKEEKDSN